MIVQAGLCWTWSETQIIVFSGAKAQLALINFSGIHVDYPNDEGQSPLFCACYANSEKLVDYLLSSGANPNE